MNNPAPPTVGMRPRRQLPVPSFWKSFRAYVRALSAPLLLWAPLAFFLYQPISEWISGDLAYDEAAIQEWVEESRSLRETLPEMIEAYVRQTADLAKLEQEAATGDLEARKKKEDAQLPILLKQQEIREHLTSLGLPPTKMYTGQMLLFPIIYRLEVRFKDSPTDVIDWIARMPAWPPGGTWESNMLTHYALVWDSDFPREDNRVRHFIHKALHPHAEIRVLYQLHTYNNRQHLEQLKSTRNRELFWITVFATPLGLGWLVFTQRREREHEYRRALAQHEKDQAERELLEQRLALQAAEQRALELKSELYASIGIMAGSYAHNIKNLLVRPNDLLNRCLETDQLAPQQETMLHEVKQTLGTVTERLQQILRTVRRDPSRSEQTRLDLNTVVREMEHTWKELARDKWKMELVVSCADKELWLAGDVSHLQQAVENLLFNSRDATFEMRNYLRDQARRVDVRDAEKRKQALIAAAAWRGRCEIRTRREGGEIVLEVCDNGAGMTEEVRRRCTETHFTTKRDNAIYEGHSTGMGLGLSFVQTILEHHHATLEIESAPQQGTTLRMRFPAKEERVVS
jgi:signal transduction histidine kinase